MSERLSTVPKLPEFDSPPIAEVVCGVAFHPLPGMIVPQYGQLWEVFRRDYPSCEEKFPLAPVQMVGGDFPAKELMELPLPRTWFVAQDGRSLIQVQRDRFLHNWRKMEKDETYPRYATVVKEFQERYDQFRDFVEDRKLGKIEHVRYELTYVNHIVGRKPEEVGDLFPDFCWRPSRERFLSSPSTVNWVTVFELPENAGHLTMAIKNGQVRNTNESVILLELTAAGIGNFESDEKMWEWYDLAHEWIVRGFADVTAPNVQNETWGRKV